MRRHKTLGILVELFFCCALGAGIVTLALAEDAGSDASRRVHGILELPDAARR